jgi:hypothetical protein
VPGSLVADFLFYTFKRELKAGVKDSFKLRITSPAFRSRSKKGVI